MFTLGKGEGGFNRAFYEFEEVNSLFKKAFSKSYFDMMKFEAANSNH